MFLPDGSVAKFGSVVLIMVVSGADEVAKWIPGDGPQALWSPLCLCLPKARGGLSGDQLEPGWGVRGTGRATCTC